MLMVPLPSFLENPRVQREPPNCPGAVEAQGCLHLKFDTTHRLSQGGSVGEP